MGNNETRVLHLVGGKSLQGGTASVVVNLVSVHVPNRLNWMWMHRDCTSEPELPLVCAGRAENLNASIAGDLSGAVRDLPELIRTIRRFRISVLHAHSRLGIFAGWLAHQLTRKPLVIHLHFLARRPWLYRFLIRSANAIPIYNSRQTCMHYGGEPDSDHVIVPTIEWPATAPASSPLTRVVAASALVPHKNVDLVLAACLHLVTSGASLRAVVFGRSPNKPTAYERRIVTEWGKTPFIELQDWKTDWSENLGSRDVFVHVGRPESFGLVLLEAFARGLRVVALQQTFLDDLPPEVRSRGIYRATEPAVQQVADAVQAAISDTVDALDLYQSRRTIASEFSRTVAANKLTAIYQSAVHGVN